MENLHSRKYLIIPNTSMRVWDLFCKWAVFFTMVWLGFYSGLVYKQYNFIGMSVITIQDKESIVGFTRNKNFIADPVDFCPNPPSDSIILLKRVTKRFEKVTKKPEILVNVFIG